MANSKIECEHYFVENNFDIGLPDTTKSSINIVACGAIIKQQQRKCSCKYCGLKIKPDFDGSEFKGWEVDNDN